MTNIGNREAFYASVRAIDALCPACKQPQNAPSCERRQHTPTRWSAKTIHDPRMCGQCAEEEYARS